MKKVFVIAEAGVNHNGDIAIAEELVRAAARAGADAVKFQTFRAEDLTAPSAEMADYQKKNIGRTTSQLEMLKSLELPRKAHGQLKVLAEELGVEFMSTPFDPHSMDFLVKEIGMRRLKIGSGELTNGPLLYRAARTGLPLILSTGMGTLAEVNEALAMLAAGFEGKEIHHWSAPASIGPAPKSCEGKVTLLHCITDYPAPDRDVNLLAMDLLGETFRLPVGYSDHTLGLEASLAAVARGATVIEKHLTIDPNLPGPDQAASLPTEDFARLVTSIRRIELLLGERKKDPSTAERKNAGVARKSLVAMRDIKSGEAFDHLSLGVKRPGHGRSPMEYWNYLGKPASRNFLAGELIE